MSSFKVKGKGDQAEWVQEEDSVDAAFAGEYSEETLEMMKKYQRPEWMEEDSSLDPVEDLDQYIQHGLAIPPKTYDSLVEAAAEQAAELRAAKDDRLEPEEQELIEYRKQLVEGTSLDEVKLLKLRAYHRAMDVQRAREAELQTPEMRRKLMELYDVPLDKFSHELIDMTPEQLAERWQRAQQGETSAHGGAAWDLSEDSEWAADWQATHHLQSASVRQELQKLFAPPSSKKPCCKKSAAATAAAASPGQVDPSAEFGEIMPFGDPSKWQEWKPVHAYTEHYLEQQRLQAKLRSQQRQRAAAFWLPLSAVLAASSVKLLKTFFRNRGSGSAAAAAAKTKKKKSAAAAGV